jgi:hypothetical protein
VKKRTDWRPRPAARIEVKERAAASAIRTEEQFSNVAEMV